MPGGKNNIVHSDGKKFTADDIRINRLGRPKKMNLERLLRKVLMERVNDETALKGILTKLRDMAMNGDIRAAELLLDRAFGKPKQTVEATRPLAIVGIQYVLPNESADHNKTYIEAASGMGVIEVE